MEKQEEIEWLKREIAWLEEMIPQTTFDLIRDRRIARLEQHRKELEELEGTE